MKKINIFYWIVTGLFAAFMLLSAIPEMMKSPDEIKMIVGLGYPEYFIPFLGIAKTLGVVAILIPNLRRLKEWAYAGLFFDLVGATYSMIAKQGFLPEMSFMFLPIIFLFLSYYLWHKKIRLA